MEGCHYSLIVLGCDIFTGVGLLLTLWEFFAIAVFYWW
jgi:hypothetical protein